MTEGPTKQLEKITALRAKAGEIQAAELAKKEKGEVYNEKYAVINPDELAEVDLEIYGKFLDQTLTSAELDAYQTDVVRDNDARKFLLEWVRNNLFLPENLKWFEPEEYAEFKDIYDSAIKKKELNNFRMTIEEIKKQEMAKKEIGEEYERLFESINPGELTENEMLAFAEFEQGPMKPEDLAAWDFLHDPDNQSAQYFFEWLRAKI